MKHRTPSLSFFAVTVCHDDGIARIHIGPLASAHEARKQIARIERCPMSAIVDVTEDRRIEINA